MTEKVAVAHRDELRERNEERSQRDAEQGPAEKNQDAAPILDAMRVNNDEHVLEKSLVSRNSHMSVVTGLVLCGASPVWVMPEYDEELEVAHGVTPEAVASALDQNPDAVAVMIVTPTYYGVSADVRGIADECHRR